MTKKLPPRVFSLSMRIPTIFSEAFSLSLSLSLFLSLYTYHLFGSVIVLLAIMGASRLATLILTTVPIDHVDIDHRPNWSQ